MVATATMLQKPDVIAYVAQNASRFNLDPAAVLAVADHEGLAKDPVNGVAPTWILPNERGLSNFGPPSWYAGGAGAAIVQQQGSLQAAANWSWTPAGLDYWLQQVAASGAAGKTGIDAITSIVKNFERPYDSSLGIDLARRAYNGFQAKVAQIQANPGGNIIVTPPDTPGNITIPGQTQPGQLPIHTDPQQSGSASATTGAKFSLHLFDLPNGPVNLTLPWDFSGILLFLAAVFAIIIGAMLWDKSRNVIVKTGEVGAMAAA